MAETKTNEADTQALAKAGVSERRSLETALVSTDEAGNTILAIPPALNEKYNVLAPAAVLTQADPHFRPSFTIVQLNPDPNAGDFYAMTGANKGKLAMSKDGILKIANAGGIDFSHDLGGKETGEAVPVYLFGTKVLDARPFSYTAIGRFRKSDGTLAAMRGEKEWIPQREALEIEVETSKKDWLKTDAERLKHAKGELLRNMDFRSMMCKAKAQNAVMRAAYGIKQKFTPAEAAKPFFVVSYNFTAGTDPSALAIVASLVGADVANLYGTNAPALPEGIVEQAADGSTVIVTDVETGEYVQAEDAGVAEVVDAEATTEEDMFAGVELPEAEEEALVYPSQEECAKYTFKSGPDAYKGKTVGTLYHTAAGRTWLQSVRKGFGRLMEEGTINDTQREAFLAIDGYFNYQGE